MEKYVFIAMFPFFIFGLGALSCKKKTKGICYCEFYSGSKSEYDYRHLSREQQKDSCALNNQNAANFVGNCKLK